VRGTSFRSRFTLPPHLKEPRRAAASRQRGLPKEHPPVIVATSVVTDMTIQKLIQILLESDVPLSAQGLIEASVHLPKRGSIFMAAFRDEFGRQVQQSTHERDRAAAQAVTDKLEADAREKRLARPAVKPGKPRVRVRRRSAERLLGVLSHAEIAAASTPTTSHFDRTRYCSFRKRR
jgi:hypothetical protein